MSGAYDGWVRIGTKIDDSDLSGDLANLKSKLQNASAKLRDVMQGPVAAVQEIGRALQKVGQIVNEVEGDWAAQEKAIAINKATLKATGAEAWTTTGAMQALADKLQKLTGYADENILSMQNVLLGFKNIKGDNFDTAAEQILNMSKVMGMDLVSSAQAVGKALDDPIAGVDSLTRQGFRFSAAQKEVLKDLVNTGHMAEAQKIILDELTTTYGGAAAAANETSSAIKEKLGVAVGELKERLGKFATDALAPSRKELTGLIAGLSDTFDVINRNGNAPEILTKLATGLLSATAGVAAFVLVSQGHAIVTALAGAIQAVGIAISTGLGPYALVGAALAALVVAILGAKRAEEEHAEALGKKLGQIREEQQEVKSLADEYQNLFSKVNPTADEQNRMAEIAKTLHERFPDLTTDTLNLAAANGTLAARTMEAVKAQEQQNLADFVKAKEKQITAQSATVSDYTLWTTELKIEQAKDAGKEFFPKNDAEKAVVRIRQLREEIKAAKAKFDSDWASPAASTSPTSTSTSTSTGSTYTDAEKIAKANYEKVEKLLASIAFFDKRDALHPYTEEEKKAFWKSARDQLFDLDALDLGPEALKLKTKVKAAIDKAFAPYGGTYGLSEATLGSADAGLQDRYDAIARQTNNEISSGPSMRTLATLGEIDQGLQELFDEVVRQIHADIAKSPTVSTLATLGDADAGLNEQYEAIVREINNAIANGPTVATLATLGESDAGLQELYDEIIRQTNNAISMGPSVATLATLGEATEGLGELFDLVVQQLNAAISKGRIVASLANEDTTGLGDQYSAMKPGLALQDALKPSEADRSDTWAVSYGRYLDEMSKKTALAPWQQAGIVGTKGEDGKVTGGTEIGNIFGDLVTLGKAFSDSLGGIVKAVTSLASVQQILNPLTTVVGAMMDVLGPVINDVLGPVVGMLKLLGETLGQILAPAIQLLTPIIEAVSKVFVFLYNSIIVPVGNAIIKAFNWVYNGIVSVLNWIIKVVNDALGWLGVHLNEIAKRAAEEGTLTVISTQDIGGTEATDALKEQNEALKANRELWTLATKAADAYAAVLTKVKGAAASFYDSLKSVGTEITSALIDNLVNGFSADDFLYAMEEYIRSSVIKAAVYSESLMASVAAIGQKISTAIANGATAEDFADLAAELRALWEAAADKAEIVTGIIDEAFGGSYDVGSLSVQGDQYAKIHDSEMILPAGIAEEARRAGVVIGPAENLGSIGAAGIAARQMISLTLNLDGSITADGREIGRIAYRHFDEFAGSAYGG